MIGAAGQLEVATRADMADAGGVEVFQRVHQRIGPEIEAVVVGQRHCGDAEVHERVGSQRRRPEDEDFVRRTPAGGDTTFEVRERNVGLVHRGDNLVGEQRFWSLLPQPLRDAAAQHHVTDQCHFHLSPSQANIR
jgi:hypothetical protein